MGPTNVALLRLFRADQLLREAEARHHSASATVRFQERRIADLNEKLKLSTSGLREQQVKANELDVDIKSRTAHIEKLRAQQQTTKNAKEYQAFLAEINTEKIDREKVEDEALKVMEQVEKAQAEVKGQQAVLAADQQKLQELRGQLSGKLAELQKEIDQLKPEHAEAAAALPSKVRDTFERLVERFDGEAMSAVGKPDRRREEYVCTACHMDLVADVYNKLHSRDDMIPCPNCRRLLFIPEDLPPELAINFKKEKKEKGAEQEAVAGE